MDYVDNVALEELKDWMNHVDWSNQKDRLEIFWRFYDLFVHWEGPYPELRDLFNLADIESLLCNTLNFCDEPRYMVFSHGLRFMLLVADKIGYKDEPELGEDGKPSSLRITPIHRAARHSTRCGTIIYNMFKVYDRFDVNYCDERGLTHFHIACAYGFVEIVEKFLEHGHDPNCIVLRTGDSPLHFALNRCHDRVVKLLLKHGADPTIANNEGSTPLHMIPWKDEYSETLLSKFFKTVDEEGLSVDVEARDHSGVTPLHKVSSQIFWRRANVIGLLLRRGADLGAACESARTTPLHMVCSEECPISRWKSLSLFFELVDDLQQTVRVNARDGESETPLHKALSHKLWGTNDLELLLERGADPNLSDAREQTCLHIICKRYEDDGLIGRFFEVNDDMNQAIQVDARDRLGWTPLQRAAASRLPDAFDTLLSRGADLNDFVFPLKDAFGMESNKGIPYYTKLRLAAGLIGIVECLEQGGYVLNQAEYQVTIDFFGRHGLFEKPATNLDKLWYDNKKFARIAQGTMVKRGLSLYRLIKLQPKEAARLVTHSDYCRLALSTKFQDAMADITEEYREACVAHLAEKLSRRFFQRRALAPYWRLIHYRLPQEICMIILEELTNQDLYNVCLAESRGCSRTRLGRGRKNHKRKRSDDRTLRAIKVPKKLEIKW